MLCGVADRDHDQVDRLVAQWADERPDLDLDAMATVARLLNLARAIKGRLAAFAADYDLSIPEADVLFTLRRAGGPYRLSPSAISDALLVPSGTMTNRLDRLERKDLIERVRHPTDRRSMEVQLTDRGSELLVGVGIFAIQWSYADMESGWLYVDALKVTTTVLPAAQFDSLSLRAR